MSEENKSKLSLATNSVEEKKSGLSLATDFVEEKKMKLSLSPEYVEERKPKLSLSPDYIEESKPKLSLSPDYVEESKPKLSLSPEYVEESKSKLSLSPDVVEESKPKLSLSPEYVEESKPKLNLSPDFVEEKKPKLSLATEYVEESKPKLSLSPEYVEESKPKLSLSPDYVEESKPKLSLAVDSVKENISEHSLSGNFSDTKQLNLSKSSVSQNGNSSRISSENNTIPEASAYNNYNLYRNSNVFDNVEVDAQPRAYTPIYSETEIQEREALLKISTPCLVGSYLLLLLYLIYCIVTKNFNVFDSAFALVPICLIIRLATLFDVIAIYKSGVAGKGIFALWFFFQTIYIFYRNHLRRKSNKPVVLYIVAYIVVCFALGVQMANYEPEYTEISMEEQQKVVNYLTAQIMENDQTLSTAINTNLQQPQWVVMKADNDMYVAILSGKANVQIVGASSPDPNMCPNVYYSFYLPLNLYSYEKGTAAINDDDDSVSDTMWDYLIYGAY